MHRKRAWVEYVEQRYGVALRDQDRQVDLDALWSTQGEIERIKYELVRYQGYCLCVPILVFKGPFGGYFLVDGHTRARAHWDKGGRHIPAVLYTSHEPEICAELEREAEAAGGGKKVRVHEVPIVDRLGGPGTEAWKRRREELKEKWLREAEAEAAAQRQGR